MGDILNETWMNNKSTPDSQEVFQSKLEEIKRNLQAITINRVGDQASEKPPNQNPNRLRLNYKDSKFNPRKSLNSEGLGDEDTVPSTSEHINMMSIINPHSNNLSEISKNKTMFLRQNSTPLNENIHK